MTNYIIGIGTGRCGTMSLARLIDGCNETRVFHEMTPSYFNNLDIVILHHVLRNTEHKEAFLKKRTLDKIFYARSQHLLPWDFDNKLAEKKRLELLSIQNYEFVGDVAFYYVNYIDYFYTQLPNLKIIHIWRDEEKVIKSFDKRLGDNNLWNINCSHPDSLAFPTFENKSQLESIRKYVEIYKEKVQTIKEKYNDIFFSLNIEDLNNITYQKNLFNFLELPHEYRNYQKVKENVFLGL